MSQGSIHCIPRCLGAPAPRSDAALAMVPSSGSPAIVYCNALKCIGHSQKRSLSRNDTRKPFCNSNGTTTECSNIDASRCKHVTKHTSTNSCVGLEFSFHNGSLLHKKGALSIGQFKHHHPSTPNLGKQLENSWCFWSQKPREICTG